MGRKTTAYSKSPNTTVMASARAAAGTNPMLWAKWTVVGRPGIGSNSSPCRKNAYV